MKVVTQTAPVIAVLGMSGSSDIIAAGGDVAHCSAVRFDDLDDVEQADGLLLLGGGDVNPRLYGEQRDKSVYGVDDRRDAVEAQALDIARAEGMPIMGICRGAQLMNVTAGGTLHQNITPMARVGSYHQGCRDADVEPVRGSRLAAAFENEARSTIHIHHQAVKDIAPGFVATGFTRDGVIEAIESVESWELGVQFHPEMASDRYAYRIFAKFVAACAYFAGVDDWQEPEYVRQFGGGWSAYGTGHTYGKKSRKANLNGGVAKTVVPIKRSNSDDFDLSAGRCGICNIGHFDKYEDFIDHIDILHGASAAASASVFAERQ